MFDCFVKLFQHSSGMCILLLDLWSIYCIWFIPMLLDYLPDCVFFSNRWHACQWKHLPSCKRNVLVWAKRYAFQGRGYCFWMLHDVTGNMGQGYARCRYFILTTSDTSKIDASVGCPVPPFLLHLFYTPGYDAQYTHPPIRDVYRKLLGSTLTTTIITSTTTQILPGTTTETRPGFFRDSLLEEFGDPRGSRWFDMIQQP